MPAKGVYIKCPPILTSTPIPGQSDDCQMGGAGSAMTGTIDFGDGSTHAVTLPGMYAVYLP